MIADKPLRVYRRVEARTFPRVGCLASLLRRRAYGVDPGSRIETETVDTPEGPTGAATRVASADGANKPIENSPATAQHLLPGRAIHGVDLIADDVNGPAPHYLIT